MTPADRYVGLDQTDASASAFVDELTEGARALTGSDASVTLGGRTWQRYDEGGDSADERVRGLLYEESGAVTLVSGTAEWGELEEFAESLGG